MQVQTLQLSGGLDADTSQQYPSEFSGGNDDSITAQTFSHPASASFAYAANPTSDTAISKPSADSGHPAHDVDATASPVFGLLDDLTPQVDHTDPVPPSFNDQRWSTRSGHYPASTTEPVGEALDELPYEVFAEFDRFDAPRSFEQSDSPIIESTATQPATSDSHTSLNGNVRKPALKRPLNSSIDAHQQTRTDSEIERPDARKLRRVEFEDMSATGIVSADDEDSVSSSDEQISTRPTTRQTAAANLTRRGRGGRTNPGVGQRGASHQSPNTRSANVPSPESRNPSAHSNPVLQPEKVFPIQIGSEVFRLSGASISSDSPSYFTQFFEEQLRNNEDGSSIRPLYIDRDPDTFRDIARHLQGKRLITTINSG